jgi:hypothetical protein
MVNRSRFEEVTQMSKKKRAEANTRTAARKAAELKEVVSQIAARSARETPKVQGPNSMTPSTN